MEARDDATDDSAGVWMANGKMFQSLGAAAPGSTSLYLPASGSKRRSNFG